VSSSPFLTPGAGPVRAAVERRMATVVVWLAHLPRLVPMVVLIAVFLTGAFAGGVLGGVLLLLVAALMGLISYLTWPSVPPVFRTFRLLILAGVVAFAVSKIIH
jgi:hypothetical protein